MDTFVGEGEDKGKRLSTDGKTMRSGTYAGRSEGGKVAKGRGSKPSAGKGADEMEPHFVNIYHGGEKNDGPRISDPPLSYNIWMDNVERNSPAGKLPNL